MALRETVILCASESRQCHGCSYISDKSDAAIGFEHSGVRFPLADCVLILMAKPDRGHGNSSRESVSFKFRSELRKISRLSSIGLSLLERYIFTVIYGCWTMNFSLLNEARTTGFLHCLHTAFTQYYVVHAMRWQHHIFACADLSQHTNRCWRPLRNFLLDHHQPLWWALLLGGLSHGITYWMLSRCRVDVEQISSEVNPITGDEY